MNQNKLLTVAIPAYNRPETLERLLKQVIEQNEVSMDILIVDDCSPDGGYIERLVTEYQKTVPNLRFYRNSENLGFNKNVCRLYELVETRYVWFICDDDNLLPGAVRSVISSLKKYEPVVAIFNHTQLNPFDIEINAGVKTDRLYERKEDLGKNYQPLVRLTFLSIIVVEKRLPVSLIKETNYSDNVYFQITLGLLLLSDKFRLVEVASPVLHRNVGFKYGDFYKFNLVDHLKAVFLIKHVFENQYFVDWSKKHLVLTTLQLYLSQKIGLISYNKKPTNETIQLMYEYYGSLYANIFLSFRYISMLIPTFLLKFLYLAILCIKHGYTEGLRIFKKNINRAFTDSRKTGFTKYI